MLPEASFFSFSTLTQTFFLKNIATPLDCEESMKQDATFRVYASVVYCSSSSVHWPPPPPGGSVAV